jgi:hypothetical protein
VGWGRSNQWTIGEPGHRRDLRALYLCLDSRPVTSLDCQTLNPLPLPPVLLYHFYLPKPCTRPPPGRGATGRASWRLEGYPGGKVGGGGHWHQLPSPPRSLTGLFSSGRGWGGGGVVALPSTNLDLQVLWVGQLRWQAFIWLGRGRGTVLSLLLSLPLALVAEITHLFLFCPLPVEAGGGAQAPPLAPRPMVI